MANTKITSRVIAADAILTANITDANITTAKIADDAVTSAKLDTNIVIAGTLGSTGKITADAGIDIDNFNIDGTTIALSSGDLTLDVAGDIILDADGADIIFADGGTTFLEIDKDGNNARIKNPISDGDIKIQGNDNGSIITALSLDMSDAGSALFNKYVTAERFYVPDNGIAIFGGGSDLKIYHDGSDSYIKDAGTGNLLIQGSDIYIGDASSNHRIILRANGNVGIGTTDPQDLLHLDDPDDDCVLNLDTATASKNSIIKFSDPDAQGRGFLQYAHSDDSFRTIVAGAERMRITAAGDLYFGQTSGSVANVGTILQANGRNFFMASTTSEAIMHTYNNTSNSGAKYIISFRQNNTEVGSIEVGSSSTALVGSSDYRLKENVDYTWDATTKLKQLKPCKFNWIVDDTNTLVDGFLAHEVQDIVPEAIFGEKDAVYTAEDEANGLGVEGKPNFQGIDQSKLIPLLVKTIQELEARLKTLEDA